MAEESAGSASLWNTGNWLWESKSIANNCELDLRERLTSIELEGGGVEIRIVEVPKLKVEAEIHVRRGKRVATFDVSFTARWEGWKAGAPRPSETPTGKQAAGEVIVSDIMQDDVAEDFVVNVFMSAISGVNTVDLRSKETAKAGLPLAIRAQLRAFSAKLSKVAADADAAGAEKTQRNEEAKKTAMANADVGTAAERVRSSEEQAVRLQQTASSVSVAVIAERQAAAAAKASIGKPEVQKADTSASALALPGVLKVESAGMAPEVRPSDWNAGAWAWETRDMSAWAHTKLTELWSNVELDASPIVNEHGRVVQSGAFLRTLNPEKLTVEASVSLRKGRKIILFDVSMELPWEGNQVALDGAVLGTGDGMLVVTDLDQDSMHEGGYTFKAIPDDEGGQIDEDLARIMQEHGVPMLKKRLEAFARELHA